MSRIWFDFETKSDLPIEVGTMNYLNTPSSDIVCLGYKREGDRTRLWAPGQAIPDCFIFPADHTWIAFNAQFDRRVWNILGRKYGFDKLGANRCIDVMAICGRYTYPQKLASVEKVLNLKRQKGASELALLKKITQPPFEYTTEELRDFYMYCKDDVDSLQELHAALPLDTLSANEQQLWELTVKMNDTGIPVDYKTVTHIKEVCEAYQIEHAQRLPDMTDHIVTKITQVQRIVKFINSKGFPIPNLQAETVEKWLKKDLPQELKDLLIMRQELGKSSVAKYTKINLLNHKGRVYDNQRFYGASTGRWAGMGFQIHNLPRASVEDPESEIQKFFDLSILEENPIISAKALIRPMVKAPEGKDIIAIDYDSIEYILLIWETGDDRALDLVRQGYDAYIDMAAHLFGVSYDQVTPDQRWVGKIIILGCGYGLGHIGFRGTAEGYGLVLTALQSKSAVNAYRTLYHLVPSFWYDSKDAAVFAIQHPGKEFTCNRSKYKVVKDRNNTLWLKLTLPSGRALFYNSPEVRDDTYGPIPTHMGINPYSKKWSRLKLIPGRIVENIIQALARDILAHGKQMLDSHGYKLVASIHDETMSEVPKQQDDTMLKEMRELMCKLPPWAEGLPLSAGGYRAKRYKKA